MTEATATDSLPATKHPALLAAQTARAKDIQLRVADKITAYAGSMRFVYIHILIFAVWMIFFERNPWPTLTLTVSLEAIFLSTFVMIGQNRQASFQQDKADHDFVNTEQKLAQNIELTTQIAQLSAQIKALTEDIHGSVVADKK
jgi:uncharacterized membrane protein